MERYNAVDKQMKADCITQAFAYACWPLCDISDKCEGVMLDEGSNLFLCSDPTFFFLFSDPIKD